MAGLIGHAACYETAVLQQRHGNKGQGFMIGGLYQAGNRLALRTCYTQKEYNEGT
jgi:hypothetical protein